VYCNRSKFILLVAGVILPTDTQQPSSLLHMFCNSDDSDQWCLQHMAFPPDSSLTLAQAIESGHAIAVSDGAFKNTYGMAAWAIEGLDPVNCFRGQTIAPGDSDSQSPYRRKLTGVFVTIVMVNNN
jgi:hypothetical protein